MRTRRKYGVAVFLASLLIGCSTVEKERLDAGNELWGGYKSGSVYEIKADIFLLELSESVGNAQVKFSLTPEASFRARSNVYGAPGSIRKYLSEGDAQVPPSSGAGYTGTSTVRGVVKSGTRIVATTAIKYRNWNWFFGEVSYVVVYADVLDGRFKGVRADIQDLSEEEYFDSPAFGEIKILNPDQAILTRWENSIENS